VNLHAEVFQSNQDEINKHVAARGMKSSEGGSDSIWPDVEKHINLLTKREAQTENGEQGKELLDCDRRASWPRDTSSSSSSSSSHMNTTPAYLFVALFVRLLCISP